MLAAAALLAGALVAVQVLSQASPRVAQPAPSPGR
jgi:hypothetical protein